MNTNTKTACFIMLAGSVALAGLQLRAKIVAGYRVEKNYTQYWELADKSSTLQMKQKYIEQFVSALESGYAKGEFSSHNAKWMKTQNNSFDANLAAVKTLSERLNQIQTMDPKSFEYNTAIQQITAQEQGEASAMIGVITGCYALACFPMTWGWICGLIILTWGILAVVVLGFWLDSTM